MVLSKNKILFLTSRIIPSIQKQTKKIYWVQEENMKWNLKEKHWFPIKQLVGRGIIQESPTRRPYTVVKMSFATHQGRYNMYILFLKKKGL